MRLLKPLGSSHQDASRFAHAGCTRPSGGNKHRRRGNGEEHGGNLSRLGALTKQRTKWFDSVAKVKGPTFACNLSRGFFELAPAQRWACAHVKQ